MKDYHREHHHQTMRRIGAVMLVIGLLAAGTLAHWLWEFASRI